MSRPIKFRVWDKKRNKMYYPGGNLFVWNNDFNYPEIGQDLEVKDSGWWSDEGIIDDEPVIQQFTGLKDKNGCEIYEGDILQMIYNTGERGEISEVIFQVISSDGVISGFECQVQSPKDSEVIGNIFESPELLK